MNLDVLLTRVKAFHMEHSYIRVGQAFMTILPLLLVKFAFEVNEYYRNNEEVCNDNNE